MLLTVDLDTQNIVRDPGETGALAEISVPRGGAVPIKVRFSRGGELVDPEERTTDILTSASASFTVSSISNGADATCTAAAAHGLSHGDFIQITATAGIPTGLALFTTYYVRVVSSTTFKLAPTYADAIANTNLIDTSSAGTAPHTFTPGAIVTTDGAHGLTTGDTVTIEDHTGNPKLIVVSSVADPTEITTASAHGLTSGDIVTITGHSGSDPSISGEYPVTVTGTTKFTIPIEVLTAGWGGYAAGETSSPTINGSRVVTVTSDTTFTVPVAVTTGGIDGVVTKYTDLDLRWTVKEDEKFDGDTLASILPGDFTKSGTGSSAIFLGYCNYITPELNTLLGVDGSPGNDEEQATLMAELSWQGAEPSKTNWIRHYARNDLYKEGESDPVGANGQDGRTTIASGLSEKAVVFSPALSSGNWHFLGAPSIWNTTADALGISFVGLSAKSASGFTAILSGETDATGTYYMDWSVRPD